MKPKLHKRLLLLLTVFLLSGNVFAHAIVTKSTFDEKSIASNKSATVSLFFNALIKVPLSRVDLMSNADQPKKLAIMRGKQLGEVRIELPALEQGEYTLNYKMHALDGHLSEGALKFMIK